jgi:hypothetical protein
VWRVAYDENCSGTAISRDESNMRREPHRYCLQAISSDQSSMRRGCIPILRPRRVCGTGRGAGR